MGDGYLLSNKTNIVGQSHQVKQRVAYQIIPADGVNAAAEGGR